MGVMQFDQQTTTQKIDIFSNNLNHFLRAIKYCYNNFLKIKWIVLDKIPWEYNENVTKSTGDSKCNSCCVEQRVEWNQEKDRAVLFIVITSYWLSRKVLQALVIKLDCVSLSMT